MAQSSGKAVKQNGKGRPFVKGQSGNPGGRAKDNEDVKLAAREHTVRAIERLAYWMESEEPKASVSASNALLDRGWGKATQFIEGNLNLGIATRLEAARARKP